jgi:virginiamycin B lyase
MKRLALFLPSGFFAVASLVVVSSCSSSSVAMPAAGAGRGLQAPSSTAERIEVKEFNDLVRGSSSDIFEPTNLTAGPDGALWVLDNADPDYGESAVVRISTSGRHTHTYFFSGLTRSGGSYLGDITAGPDGALWLTDSYNDEILRLGVRGRYRRFPLGADGTLGGIVSGPDKALWATENFGTDADVVRITTQGAVTSYSTTGNLLDIASGSDGALWFTDFDNGRIGRITTAGKITWYSKGLSSGAKPESIAPGPDGALWFTDEIGRIGRITTHGQITEYSGGITQPERPQDLVAGPDGAMWFTEFDFSYAGDAKIGRITMQGGITEYSKINPVSGPTGIAKGLKGDLWFVETNTNEVGRLRIR